MDACILEVFEVSRQCSPANSIFGDISHHLLDGGTHEERPNVLIDALNKLRNRVAQERFVVLRQSFGPIGTSASYDLDQDELEE